MPLVVPCWPPGVMGAEPWVPTAVCTRGELCCRTREGGTLLLEWALNRPVPCPRGRCALVLQGCSLQTQPWEKAQTGSGPGLPFLAHPVRSVGCKGPTEGYPPTTATITSPLYTWGNKGKRWRGSAQGHNQQGSLDSNTVSVAPEPERLITTSRNVSWSEETEEIKITAELKTKGSHEGLPWWLRGKESTYQCRGHGFNPWARRSHMTWSN